MSNRRTFLKRLGIGTLGGAMVAKAATEARIPATGPTTRLPEPEPEPVEMEPWFGFESVKVAISTVPTTTLYWFSPTTDLQASGAAYCGKCREPLPLGASYCIYCATEVA